MLDDRHIIYLGWVAGIALRHGLLLEPVYDGDDNFTGEMQFVGHGHVITLVVPYPSADWTVDG